MIMKTILQFVIGVAVSMGLAALLRIDAGADYGWFMGAVQGLLLVPNWLISLFDPSWLVKAPQTHGLYNGAWWTCAVIDVLYWLWAVAGMAVTAISSRRP